MSKYTKIKEPIKTPKNVSNLSNTQKEKITKYIKMSKHKKVRKLLELISKLGKPENVQIAFCEESIQWCLKEKRNFLRQRLEIKKAELLFKLKKYHDAVEILKRLTNELKKLDDKQMLIDVCLLESRVQTILNNIPIAKNCLMTARTASNSVYVPPELQARLDLQSGHVALSEKDYKSSFSYYYESFEGYEGLRNREMALFPLKYMFLSKMLGDKTNDISTLMRGKVVSKYDCDELNAIRRIAECYKSRCLEDYKKVLELHKNVLQSDPIISRHLDSVSRSLIEKNIIRVVEPYSAVEVSHIAHCVGMQRNSIEKILSRMILDNKINGVIDQFKGTLIINRKTPKSNLYESALKIITQLDLIVEKKAHEANLYKSE